MERRRLWPLAVLLFVVGAGTFSRFASHVRTVDAVGLSGAGFSIGVGFALLMFKPGRPEV
jgi:hypothetical protein